MKKETFYSNGKLLISGEYLVLDGALALAVPTKLGQSLEIENISEPKIIWISIDEKEAVWFKDEFLIQDINANYKSTNEISKRLIEILTVIKQLNPDLINTKSGYKITTRLGFPKNWGLGTSSTLIYNLAQWSKIDAYKLLSNTFGGSGYDIACAKNNTPITYLLKNKNPIIESVDFYPPFKDKLYFVHLNQKQNSRVGIKNYNDNKAYTENAIIQINSITTQLINTTSLNVFESLLTEHEDIIAKITKQTPVKERLFSDFKGCVKSLGAWGGDFVLVTSIEDPTLYFKNKGFNTIIPYPNMVLDTRA